MIVMPFFGAREVTSARASCREAESVVLRVLCLPAPAETGE